MNARTPDEHYDHMTSGDRDVSYGRNQGLGGEVYAGKKGLRNAARNTELMKRAQAAEQARFNAALQTLMDRWGTYEEKTFGPRQNGAVASKERVA